MSGGKIYYTHRDHLGSSSVVTESTGIVVNWNAHRQYGENWQISPAGTVDLDKHRFTGKETDSTTGLIYFGARFYDPEVGRFTTVDPARDGGNWYVYCSNNPIYFIDLDGLYQSPAWMRALIPGQVSWDNAVTAWENGKYGEAALWTGVMLGEQYMFVYTWKSSSTVSNGTKLAQKSNSVVARSKGTSSTVKVPQKAYDVADDVLRNNGAPPNGYKGGRVFQNDARAGGQKLPDGVKYKEYDVNPYIKGQNRGPERIVIGDDGSVWYTSDHYNTFTRIK